MTDHLYLYDLDELQAEQKEKAMTDLGITHDADPETKEPDQVLTADERAELELLRARAARAPRPRLGDLVSSVALHACLGWCEEELPDGTLKNAVTQARRASARDLGDKLAARRKR